MMENEHVDEVIGDMGIANANNILLPTTYYLPYVPYVPSRLTRVCSTTNTRIRKV